MNCVRCKTKIVGPFVTFGVDWIYGTDLDEYYIHFCSTCWNIISIRNFETPQKCDACDECYLQLKKPIFWFIPKTAEYGDHIFYCYNCFVANFSEYWCNYIMNEMGISK